MGTRIEVTITAQDGQTLPNDIKYAMDHEMPKFGIKGVTEKSKNNEQATYTCTCDTYDQKTFQDTLRTALGGRVGVTAKEI